MSWNICICHLVFTHPNKNMLLAVTFFKWILLGRKCLFYLRNAPNCSEMTLQAISSLMCVLEGLS